MRSAASYVGAVASAVAGVGTVAMAANLVRSSAPIPPPFDPKGSRFDQQTFFGRWSSLLIAIDPASLLARDSDIRAARESVDAWKAGDQSKSDQELWSALALRNSAYGSAPDVSESIVPQPARMAGYVPYNGPVAIAMMASTSTGAIVFWNWANQTQNAMVNYFNRNPTVPMDTATMASSYAGAVSAAMGISFGLTVLVKKQFPPAQALRVLKFVAFPACVVASCANCYIVRAPETSVGWPLEDAEGRVVADGALSCNAAKKGVYETVVSRGLLQVPVLFVPALGTSLPPVAAAIAATPALGLPITTFLCLVSFGLGLPASLAFFPQRGEIDAADLEPEFQAATARGGGRLYYNRGL